jgi:hypothetical protein
VPDLAQNCAMALPATQFCVPCSGNWTMPGGPPVASDQPLNFAKCECALTENLLELARNWENRGYYLLRVELGALEMTKRERHSHKVGNIPRVHLLDDRTSVMLGGPRAYL